MAPLVMADAPVPAVNSTSTALPSLIITIITIASLFGIAALSTATYFIVRTVNARRRTAAAAKAAKDVEAAAIVSGPLRQLCFPGIDEVGTGGNVALTPQSPSRYPVVTGLPAPTAPRSAATDNDPATPMSPTPVTASPASSPPGASIDFTNPASTVSPNMSVTSTVVPITPRTPTASLSPASPSDSVSPSRAKSVIPSTPPAKEIAVVPKAIALIDETRAMIHASTATPETPITPSSETSTASPAPTTSSLPAPTATKPTREPWNPRSTSAPIVWRSTVWQDRRRRRPAHYLEDGFPPNDPLPKPLRTRDRTSTGPTSVDLPSDPFRQIVSAPTVIPNITQLSINEVNRFTKPRPAPGPPTPPKPKSANTTRPARPALSTMDDNQVPPLPAVLSTKAPNTTNTWGPYEDYPKSQPAALSAPPRPTKSRLYTGRRAPHTATEPPRPITPPYDSSRPRYLTLNSLGQLRYEHNPYLEALEQ